MDSQTQIPVPLPNEAPTGTETTETPVVPDTTGDPGTEQPRTEETNSNDIPNTETQEGEEKPIEGAPEEYADFTVPENMALDETALEEFKPLAKELNLNQEQAQKLVDIASKMNQQFRTRQLEAWQATQDSWQKAAKADKEYGGDKFKENAEAARRVINTFGTPEFKQFLNDYGLGNHPEAVRMFVRISKALKEDSLVVSGNQTHKQESFAKRLYPNLPD